MSLKDTVSNALGFDAGEVGKKVRYGIVALGDIAQEAMMPGFKHTGNSEITAFVTGDSEKAKELSEKYEVRHTYTYEQFEQLLHSGTIDAIYLATPNWRHAEFAVPALKAGIHVLLEKPMEVNEAKCQEILEAARSSTAKLMVAYRLHFEPATLSAIERVRSGVLGQVHTFTSTFAQNVDPKNHRGENGWLTCPVLDMGPYPVNAVRNLFESEPIEVIAFATRHPESGLGDFDDTVAVTLRFPDNRLAQFVVSYYGNAINAYTVVGTKGDLEVNPGYIYGKSLEHYLTLGESQKHKSFKNTDHFGGELRYFSECILNGHDPEPDAEEGYADVRVIDAIHRALENGTRQVLDTFTRSKRINLSQVQKLSAAKAPDLVNTSNPGLGKEKVPKN